MKRPNFYLVGAPKAATTSMHYYLNQHPDIYMSEHKEPHFFCKDFIRDNEKLGLKQLKMIKSKDDYLKLFENGIESKIIGDASTTNFYSKDAPSEIFNFNNDSKIIIILREPVSLMISWYNYLRYYSMETKDSFEEALKAEELRKSGKDIPKTVFFRDFLMYRNIVQFDKHIENYLSSFDSNNILILLFDDIIQSLEQQLLRICQFLEVDEKFKFDLSQQKNVRKNVKNESFKFYVDKNLFWLQRKLLPYRETQIMKFIHSVYTKMFTSTSSGNEISSEYIKTLKSELHDVVEKTNKYVDSDLIEKWGY